MANDCSIHAGKHNRFRRENLDALMRSLPENQSGHGRHKCTYCSYEQGFRDGVAHAGEALKTLLLSTAEDR